MWWNTIQKGSRKVGGGVPVYPQSVPLKDRTWVSGNCSRNAAKQRGEPTKTRQVLIYSFANECVLFILFLDSIEIIQVSSEKKLVEEILPFVTVDSEISREMEMLQFIAVTMIWKRHGSSAFSWQIPQTWEIFHTRGVGSTFVSQKIFIDLTGH